MQKVDYISRVLSVSSSSLVYNIVVSLSASAMGQCSILDKSLRRLLALFMPLERCGLEPRFSISHFLAMSAMVIHDHSDSNQVLCSYLLSYSILGYLYILIMGIMANK